MIVKCGEGAMMRLSGRYLNESILISSAVMKLEIEIYDHTSLKTQYLPCPKTFCSNGHKISLKENKYEELKEYVKNGETYGERFK